jgi:ABC-type multidrug transport system fused ATPase/permease subunit
MLHRISGAPISFFDHHPNGRILNRFSSDQNINDTFIPSILFEYLMKLLHIVSSILLVCIIAPLFLVFVIPLGFLFYVIQLLFRNSRRETARLRSVTFSPLFSYISELSHGISTIRPMYLTGYLRSKFEKILNTNLKVFYSQCYLNRWFDLRFDILVHFAVLGTFSIVLILRESISQVWIAFAIAHILTIADELSRFTKVYVQVENAFIGVERVCEYTEIEQEKIIESNISLDDNNRSIEIENLNVKYSEDGPRILNSINCKIEAGECIGIIGRSGAGKSSFILSLLNLIDHISGRVSLGDVNMKQVNSKELRKFITVIPQIPIIFKDTIKANIDPFDEHSEDEIFLVLKKVQLNDFINQLPDKINEIVDETKLSFGQKQLLSIARAILKSSKIIILDEATSNIEHETDLIIQEIIKNEFKDKTVIIVAHRLTTIQHVDKIMAIENGNIIEFDDPNVLKKDENSLYYKYLESSNSNKI